MSRRSSLSRLPTAIRAAVDDALRDGATIDEIVTLLQGLGRTASRSAVGRYAQDARRLMERTERSREMARIMVGRIADDPESDMLRGISGILQSVLWEFMDPVDEGQRPMLTPKDFHDLSKAIHHLLSADKVNAEKSLKLKDEARKQAEAAAVQALETTARKAGLTKDTIASIKAEFLGMAR
jgi:hypothetical protein